VVIVQAHGGGLDSVRDSEKRSDYKQHAKQR